MKVERDAPPLVLLDGHQQSGQPPQFVMGVAQGLRGAHLFGGVAEDGGEVVDLAVFAAMRNDDLRGVDFAALAVAQPRFAAPQAAADRRRKGLAAYLLLHFLRAVVAHAHLNPRDVVLRSQPQQRASRWIQIEDASLGIGHGDVVGGLLEDGEQACLHALAEHASLLFHTRQAFELFVETLESGLGLLEIADVVDHHHGMQVVRLLQRQRRPPQRLHQKREMALEHGIEYLEFGTLPARQPGDGAQPE